MTPRQRAFVDAYAGNATEAAIAAGYSPKSARSHGCRLMKDPRIREAIERRDEEAAVLRAKRRADALEEESAPRVLSRLERQQEWTKIALDPKEKTSDRLRALELLGKSEGDFMERIEHSTGSEDFAAILEQARKRAVGVRVSIPIVDPYAKPAALPKPIQLDVEDAEIVVDEGQGTDLVAYSEGSPSHR